MIFFKIVKGGKFAIEIVQNDIISEKMSFPPKLNFFNLEN